MCVRVCEIWSFLWVPQKQTLRWGLMFQWCIKNMLQEKLFWVWVKQGRAGKKSIKRAISSNISASAWSHGNLWSLNYIRIFLPLRKELGFHTLLQSDIATGHPGGNMNSWHSLALCAWGWSKPSSPGLSSEEDRGCRSWRWTYRIGKRDSRISMQYIDVMLQTCSLETYQSQKWFRIYYPQKLFKISKKVTHTLTL